GIARIEIPADPNDRVRDNVVRRYGEVVLRDAAGGSSGRVIVRGAAGTQVPSGQVRRDRGVVDIMWDAGAIGAYSDEHPIKGVNRAVPVLRIRRLLSPLGGWIDEPMNMRRVLHRGEHVRRTIGHKDRPIVPLDF